MAISQGYNEMHSWCTVFSVMVSVKPLQYFCCTLPMSYQLIGINCFSNYDNDDTEFIITSAQIVFLLFGVSTL